VSFHDLNQGVSDSSTIHQPQPHSLCIYTLLSGFTRHQSLPSPSCATDKEN